MTTATILPSDYPGGQYNATPLALSDQQTASLQIDSAGNLKVNMAGGAGSGTFGVAFPATGTAIGFSDGTNLVAGRVGDVNNVAAATGYLDTLVVARYNATLPTMTDTRFGALQLDARSNLHTSIWDADSTSGAKVLSQGTDAISAGTFGLAAAAYNRLFNAVAWDRARSIITGTDSIGTGISAVGLVAQLDDTAPSTVTENQFGNVRMNSARALYHEAGPYILGRATADAQIKATAGFVHTLTISPTGTVTAGVLTLYDSAAESGTVICAISLPITSFTPFSVLLDIVAGTGLYVGFDATLANVQATVSYR